PSTVDQHAGPSRPSPEDVERSTSGRNGRTCVQAMKKILVIDDSPTVRQQVGLALSQAGYHVVEAVDGVDAIGKVDASIARLIWDVNMRRMNGLEMLEKLRTDARWKALPVVMLTTEGQPGLIERAKKAGAKGWIIKPFKAELLVAAVQRLTA